MKTRRSFLATVASGSVGVALTKPDAVLAQAAPSPAASTKEKPASAVATAVAATMRRFDPGLSDDDLRTIAKAIDANNAEAKALHPKRKPLRNGDAPIVRFTVEGGGS